MDSTAAGCNSSSTCSSSSPPATTAAVLTPTSEEPAKVKFLCSFGGAIMPRPLDGRLRYVGGETRIVSVPRDVSFDELMSKMRELFDGVAVIKYQQPDEDLDALVSVVNDDDVMNMMEEYDKLGATGDGFTRLRIFLFSELESIAAASQFDADERDSERRYVDALNSLSDGKLLTDSVAEQFYGLHGIDGLHSHLHHLNIPQPSRYSDVDAGQWSPAFYSPGQHTPRDTRDSPSSARYQLGEFSDRIGEEYARHSPAYQSQQFDHQPPPYADNMVWLPPGSVFQEKAGFPSNIGHSHNIMEGNHVCDSCRVAYPRNQSAIPDTRYFDFRWKHGQREQMGGGSGNEFMAQFGNTCAECYRGPDSYILNPEATNGRGIYSDPHGHEGGWTLHNQPNQRQEDLRGHGNSAGWGNEPYLVDQNGMKIHYGQSHLYDGHPVHPASISPDDSRYLRPTNDPRSEVFHEQQRMAGSSTHIPGLEDPVSRFSNYPSAYGPENVYNLQSGSSMFRRNPQASLHAGQIYDTGPMPPNGTSPRYHNNGMDERAQNLWTAASGSTLQNFEIDGSSRVGNYGHGSEMNPNVVGQVARLSVIPESVQLQHHVLYVEGQAEASTSTPSSSLPFGYEVSSGYRHPPKMSSERNEEKKAKESERMFSPLMTGKETDESRLGGSRLAEEQRSTSNFTVSNDEANCITRNISVECLIPELIASVKKAVVEEAEEVKAKAEADAVDSVRANAERKDPTMHELDTMNTDVEGDAESDNEQSPKIETTTAEAEALAKGLQTIKNADLEEIRELGSGAYGAVYHGKWKGCDVAIKRIKSSCFAGKPSERQRLIADFWKEALILSSLHHPNVVSFYGVVRDGPDGTLATVTEFMVNGSLKQFLQKKDRSIDRRKRLILAMDVAFGMEYLHGKNIVHFDLKCENLLVNMRDPHRPICKIGDLGLSKVKQKTLVSGGIRGTLPWMAPELLSGKTSMVTEKIDVYSFGIVMWELLTGEDPYSDMRFTSIIGGIVNNTLRPKVPTWCDPEWRALMESSWAPDPMDRPSFAEIAQKLRKMATALNVK